MKKTLLLLLFALLFQINSTYPQVTYTSISNKPYTINLNTIRKSLNKNFSKYYLIIIDTFNYKHSYLSNFVDTNLFCLNYYYDSLRLFICSQSSQINFKYEEKLSDNDYFRYPIIILATKKRLFQNSNNRKFLSFKPSNRNIPNFYIYNQLQDIDDVIESLLSNNVHINLTDSNNNITKKILLKTKSFDSLSTIKYGYSDIIVTSRLIHSSLLLNSIKTFDIYKPTATSNLYNLYSVDLSIEYNHYYKNKRLITVGYGLGLGYNSIQAKLTNDSIFNYYFTIDSSGEQYQRNIQSDSLVEEIKLSYLYIPFSLKLKLFFSKNYKSYLYFNIGGRLSYLYYSKYKAREGNISYSGYYANYGTGRELRNIDQFEFYDNQPVFKGDNNLELKSYNFSVYTSVGMSIYLTKYIDLNIGAIYNYSITNAATIKDENYIVSHNRNDYYSLLYSYKKININSLGAEIGLTFKF